jgi:hypothetical protein
MSNLTSNHCEDYIATPGGIGVTKGGNYQLVCVCEGGGASIISIRYQTKKMQDYVGLVLYWTASGIISFFILVLKRPGVGTVCHSGN